MHGLGLGFEFFSLSNANKLKRVRVRLAELVNEGREKRSVLMAAYGALISGPMKRESSTPPPYLALSKGDPRVMSG